MSATDALTVIIIALALVIGTALGTFVFLLVIRSAWDTHRAILTRWTISGIARARGESKATVTSVPATVALRAPESNGDALTAERDRYRLEA